MCGSILRFSKFPMQQSSPAQIVTESGTVLKYAQWHRSCYCKVSRDENKHQGLPPAAHKEPFV